MHLSVFVRIRPLTAKEIENSESTIYITSSPKDSHIIQYEEKPSIPSSMPSKIHSISGFEKIFLPEQKNDAVYRDAVAPLVLSAVSGGVGGCYCYGHTGAGKTYTVMGYGQELGVCTLAVQHMFNLLGKQDIERGVKDIHDVRRRYLAVRYYEIYNNDVFDLLDNRRKGDLREDEDGEILFRGEAIKDSGTGAVRVAQLTSVIGHSAEEIISAIEKGNAFRSSGNSNTHSQSSRSHAVLEFEVITEEVVYLRAAIEEAKALLVPDGSTRDTAKIVWELSAYQKDPVSGQMTERPLTKELKELKEAFEKAQAIVDAHEKKIAALKKEEAAAIEKVPGVGGSLVFIDLAGAESSLAVSETAKLLKKKMSTKEEKESRQINTSLLAVKECIRALYQKSSHVPFRNSKLTLALRKYLTASRSETVETVMIANVCPVAAQASLTKNTLSYAQLLVQAVRKDHAFGQPEPQHKPMEGNRHAYIGSDIASDAQTSNTSLKKKEQSSEWRANYAKDISFNEFKHPIETIGEKTQLEIAIATSLETSQPEPDRGLFANETESEAFLKRFQQKRKEEAERDKMINTPTLTNESSKVQTTQFNSTKEFITPVVTKEGKIDPNKIPKNFNSGIFVLFVSDEPREAEDRDKSDAQRTTNKEGETEQPLSTHPQIQSTLFQKSDGIFQNALKAYDQRNYSKAFNLFTKLKKLYPTNLLVLNNLGQTLYAMGRYKDAISHYQECLVLPMTKEQSELVQKNLEDAEHGLSTQLEEPKIIFEALDDLPPPLEDIPKL